MSQDEFTNEVYMVDFMFGVWAWPPRNELFDKERRLTLLPWYYRGTSEPPVVTGGTGVVPDSGQKIFMIISFYFDWVQMYPFEIQLHDWNLQVPGDAPGGFKH